MCKGVWDVTAGARDFSRAVTWLYASTEIITQARESFVRSPERLDGWPCGPEVLQGHRQRYCSCNRIDSMSIFRPHIVRTISERAYVSLRGMNARHLLTYLRAWNPRVRLQASPRTVTVAARVFVANE